MKHPILKAIPAAVALLLTFGQACASDAEGEFHGYLRAGAGSNSEKGSQACFGLNGVSKFRLGNECDTYLELQYTKEFAKSSNGVSFVGTVMANSYTPASQAGLNDPTNSSKLGLNQYWVAAKGLPFLNGGTAWAGNRFYNRPDVHMMDWQYVNMSGVGAGIDGYPMGPGKFSYALVRDDRDSKNSSTRNHFIYDSVPLNADGGLKFNLTLIGKDSVQANAHGGWAGTVEYNQGKVLGGSNSLVLQYGAGSAARAEKFGQVGNVTDGSDVTRTRLIDHIVWQLGSKFTGQAVIAYQRDKLPAGNETWFTYGIRPVYAMTENIKLQMELGQSQVSPAGGGETQRLTKITFAPTLTVGTGYYARPELRAFVTYGKWNSAAQAAASAGTPMSATGVFGSRTSGLSAGIQVEAWW